MHREFVHSVLLITTSIAIGSAAWSGHVLTLPIAFLFPLLWALARTRLSAALISAGYFLAASRGLPEGVVTFYASDLWLGLLLWICASTGFVTVHAFLWTRSDLARPPRYIFAALLMAVPPFGITGWAHPLSAAGVLFPGWDWWGLAAATAGLAGLATRLWPVVASILAACWLWSATTWKPPKMLTTWRGVDLTFGSSLGRNASMHRHRYLIATTLSHAAPSGRTIVLPESSLGFWTPTVERVWLDALEGANVTVIAGAVELNAGGYDNVLIALSADGARTLYRERMPVPISMWQPWRPFFGMSGGARAHIFHNPVVSAGGWQIAPLICYEQLIVWPVLHSMLHDPDVIVAVGNGWWTKGTSIVEIQRGTAEAWARLFDKPIVIAFNE